MSKRKSILLFSVGIISGVAILVATISFVILYRSAFEQQRERLAVTARSQARLLEAVARFDALYSQDYEVGGSRGATLSQMVDAHSKYVGFGATGEFTMARREGDQIVYLLRHRHDRFGSPDRISWNSNLAAPMRNALSGRSGTTIALDYRGKLVLAAYEPVEELGYGIVAKIDVQEIRRPFVIAGLITGAGAIAAIALGSILYCYSVNPLIKRIEENEIRYRCPVEHAFDGIFTLNEQGIIEAFNPGAERIFQYSAEEVIGRSVSILLPSSNAHDRGHLFFRDAGVSSDRTNNKCVEIHGRRKNGEGVPLTLSVGAFQVGDRRYYSAVVRDDTERQRTNAELRKQAQQQAAISEIGQVALSSVDLTELFDEAVRLVAEVLGAKYCCVLKVVPGNENELLLLSGVGWQDGYVGRTICAHPSASEHNHSRTGAIVVENAQGASQFDLSTLLAAHDVGGGVSVGIVRSEDVFGVLGAYSDSVQSFSRSERQFLQTVADVLAQAIERKHNEETVRDLYETMRENDRQFVELLTSSPDAVSLIDGEIFVDCNDTLVHMLGYTSQDELKMLHPSAFSPPVQPDGRSSHEKANEMIAMAFENGFHRFEWVHRKANGEDFPVEVTLTAIPFQGKRLLHCLWRDVTEAKAVEKRLNAMSRAVEQSPVAIMITDTRGVIEYVNPKFTELTGYSAEEAVGKTPRILKSGEHATAEYKVFWETITAGKTWRGEFMNRRKDGELYWESASVSPILDSKGNITHFVGVKEELTDIKQAQLALKRSEERYRTLYESAIDAYVTLSAEQCVLGGNPAALRLFGYEDQEEFTSLGLADLSPERQHDGASSLERAQEMIAIAKSAGTHFFEWTLKRADGTEFPATILLVSMELDGKNVVQATIRDVSAERAMERELVQAQKLESIGQLASGIAHEINTPTQYIGDNMRFLSDSIQDLIELIDLYGGLMNPTRESLSWDERHAMIEKAIVDLDVEFLREEIPNAIRQSLEGVDRVAKIVRSMKEFAHPDGNSKQAADLNRAIESTITVARNEWKYVAEVELDLDPDLPLVPCLISEFNQVILNLIINAAHAISDTVSDEFGTEKGLISVATRCDGNWVEIRVRDTGTGIPDEIREKVFDPFFTTKEVGRGTGQGLAIARSTIVQKHGGTIDIESRLGEGTTFIIRLPIETEAGVSERSESETNRCSMV